MKLSFIYYAEDLRNEIGWQADSIRRPWLAGGGKV